MMKFSAFRRRTVLVWGVLSALVASPALAGVSRAPFCLSEDGNPPEPGETCCDSTPTTYTDEDGSLGNGTVVGELFTRADTFHSIGFEWDIDGDADHDGSVSVLYRKAGACNFSPAMPLVRTDYEWFWRDETGPEPTNNFAGSLMFLTPGTDYEVVLELSDPDGGRAIRVTQLTTRAIPRKPTAGRTFYVVPGNGGGDGSSGNPFQGIAAANAAAQPGDRFRLRDGTYSGKSVLSSSGQQDNYIVWEPDVGAAPVLGAIELRGDYIWLDRLTLVGDGSEGVWQDHSGIYASPNFDIDGIVITNCNISGFHRGVMKVKNGNNWVISDNTLTGTKPVGVWVTGTPGNSDAKGIGLGGEGQSGGGTGHIISYNSITRFSDAINSGAGNDIYGNQIWDNEDDSFSSDGSMANVRLWGNRLHDSGAYAISFQPQGAGPWYFLYNQFAKSDGSRLFKWRVPDRNVFVNNTFVGNFNPAHYFMRGITRNNLFIRGSGQVWGGVGSNSDTNDQRAAQWLPGWNTDVDYDGFDWGSNTNSAFQWFNLAQNYADIPSFAAAIGVEQNARRVNRNNVFEQYLVSKDHSLTLNPSGNAVDGGAYLPNLADFFTGSAPDLGAFETGGEPLHFGPRTGTELHDKELHWDKH